MSDDQWHLLSLYLLATALVYLAGVAALIWAAMRHIDLAEREVMRAIERVERLIAERERTRR